PAPGRAGGRRDARSVPRRARRPPRQRARMNAGRPVLVIGCGLIGTSLALALSEQGRVVHLADAVQANLELAVSRGAGSPDPVADPEIVVVAVPPSVVTDVVREALERYPRAVITDVTSVKAGLIAAVEQSGHG